MCGASCDPEEDCVRAGCLVGSRRARACCRWLPLSQEDGKRNLGVYWAWRKSEAGMVLPRAFGAAALYLRFAPTEPPAASRPIRVTITGRAGPLRVPDADSADKPRWRS